MPVYQDKSNGTWFVKCYYTDYMGVKRQRKKRGFKLQRDAKAWERRFLETEQKDVTMLFSDFAEVYLEDIKHRCRESTIKKKIGLLNEKILPMFGKKRLSDINVVDIRRWQNALMDYRNEQNEPYSGTYLKRMNGQLSAIFNYAVKYYGLKENPCNAAGSIGKNRAKEMQFWTPEEFHQFINFVDYEVAKMGFLVLYYTGARIGEMLALTKSDIDFKNHTINIDKSFQQEGKKEVITPPKTEKGVRKITIPAKLESELRDYADRMYGLEEWHRLFPFNARFYGYEMEKGIAKSGVKRIRLHDLRHSHASLLINMGVSSVAIAERLGHENVKTTLNVYGHIFPDRKEEIASKLNDIY